MSKYKSIIQAIIVLFLLIFSPRVSYATTNTAVVLSALDRLGTAYPELYKELLNLPEVKDNPASNKDALEKIALLGLSKENKPVIDGLLNEGLKTKRKYCTPLQALLWLAYEKNIDECKQLLNRPLNSILINAWTDTSESKNFSSERWKDFNEVTYRLNSPQIISIYLQNRFSYSYRWLEFEGVKSAKELFNLCKGACYDYALFSTYLLKKNGYDNAWITAVKFNRLINGLSGHVGNIYQDPKDSLYYCMNTGSIFGPFKTSNDAMMQIFSYGSSSSREKVKLNGYTTLEFDLNKGIYKKSFPYFLFFYF